MKLIGSIVLVALMMSCSVARQVRINEFKELTKDMRIETADETRMAQVLYLRMVNKRNYYGNR
tara:strand:+ start:1212 stop:1400 length:189 start_codon:yes stop_codon:yes gene_type:complete